METVLAFTVAFLWLSVVRQKEIKKYGVSWRILVWWVNKSNIDQIIHFFFVGLCLVQLMLRDDRPMTLKRKIGIAIGVLYVVIGMFLFGVTVTGALMTDIEGKYLV